MHLAVQQPLRKLNAGARPQALAHYRRSKAAPVYRSDLSRQVLGENALRLR